MLKKILIVAAALVAVFALVVALQPGAFRVERKATIAAPDSVLFAQVNDFHMWDAWSPWAKLDPAMKQTYEGPRRALVPSTPGPATRTWVKGA